MDAGAFKKRSRLQVGGELGAWMLALEYRLVGEL